MKLTLNDHTYSSDELHDLIQQKRNRPLSDWERSFFQFLHYWFDRKESIPANTSGSTGEPKSILLSKKSMLASAKLTNKFFDLQENDTAYLCLSADYIAGKMMIVRALAGNLHLIVSAPTSYPIINEPVKFAAMVPLQVELMLATPEGKNSLERISTLIIGGSPVSAALETKIQSLSTSCFCTYGMTETVSHIALRAINGKNRSAEYVGLDGVWFEKDERDCLIIHAPHLQTEPFITNDLINLKSNNVFEWIGRYDHVINTGGIKIYPETIEHKIAPFISNRFFIAGVSDEVLGQRVVLVIEGAPFSVSKMQDLQKTFSVQLLRYEKPRQIIFFPHFLETSSGKVRRIIPTHEE